MPPLPPPLLLDRHGDAALLEESSSASIPTVIISPIPKLSPRSSFSSSSSSPSCTAASCTDNGEGVGARHLVLSIGALRPSPGNGANATRNPVVCTRNSGRRPAPPGTPAPSKPCRRRAHSAAEPASSAPPHAAMVGVRAALSARRGRGSSSRGKGGGLRRGGVALREWEEVFTLSRGRGRGGCC